MTFSFCKRKELAVEFLDEESESSCCCFHCCYYYHCNTNDRNIIHNSLVESQKLSLYEPRSDECVGQSKSPTYNNNMGDESVYPLSNNNRNNNIIETSLGYI